MPEAGTNMDGAFAPAAVALAQPISVLGRFNAAFAEAVGIARVGHRSALNALIRRATLPEGAVRAGFAAVERDWRDCYAATGGGVSTENWRWHVPKLGLSPANASAEVGLERALIAACELVDPGKWANQVPVASGVAGGARERRRAIDLVHRMGEDHFELIELKVASDTPLYAACEIIGYTCVWLLAREHLRSVPNTLLDARQIDAVVLAPVSFYARYRLQPLETLLGAELAALGREHGVILTFRLESFPDELATPPFTDDQMLRLVEERRRLSA